MSNPPEPVNWHLIMDTQLEITRWADEQFPGRTDHQTVFKLMVHEIPELMTHKKEKGTAGIGTELADCFILLMDLASMWGVDLTEAIRAKMETNYQRTWERDTHGIYQHVTASTVVVPIPKMQCPSCGAEEIRETNRTDYLYQCLVCNHTFNDDCPF